MDKNEGNVYTTTYRRKLVKYCYGFERRANFLHCIRAIDGKHIQVIQPRESGSLYFNYKEYFSFVLLAVCDADYTFTYVDIGSYGRSSNSSIFKQTPFYKRMMDNTLHIPAPTHATRTVDTITPFMFVGDEAFVLSENVLRPYGGKNLSEQKKIFNYRLSRARRTLNAVSVYSPINGESFTALSMLTLNLQ
jgi:hypothetical protein